MPEEAVVIAVDVLGGDEGPAVVLEGVARALATDPALKVLLTGPAQDIEPFVALHPGRVEARATTQFISMDEHPAHAVRDKTDSSIVVGCKLVKEGSARGFFSAGSTGACMAAALLYMGRIKGVARPAIATILPSPAAPVILLDVGANADVKPEYLLQFGQMARIYAQKVLGIAEPTSALLNIGEEETKGSQLAQDAYALLQAELEGFAGNAEGTDILAARFDIIVTDGFTGNVTLKTIEGTAGMLFAAIKQVLGASFKGKLAGALVQSDLRALAKSVSAEQTGGAPLLGLKGVCIIGHGSSSALAIANGIAVAARAVRQDITGDIAQKLSV
ncbi:MAG: phosphate acyltransferase PlsX [Coriobacteriales bacterium]|jgi:glycerol-3-phosphate acyltransferase PlsX|nr:phosphate acyltransferase PlsX [Coriobacteriales bacterium]